MSARSLAGDGEFGDFSDTVEELTALARAVAATTGCLACVIGCEASGNVVAASAGEVLHAERQSLLAAARRHFERSENSSTTLSIPREFLARFLNKQLHERVSCAIAARTGRGSVQTIVVILSTQDPSNLAGVAQIVGAAAGSILKKAEIAASRDFWRRRASAVGEQLATAQREHAGAVAAVVAASAGCAADLKQQTSAAKAEVKQLHKLARDLGQRLFTAIDDERRRIARDLHDDQAQLLMAARISLETDPAQARLVLKQLDEALRQRVRLLRPATLGRTGLLAALRFELNRLTAAGIKGKLVGGKVTAALSRPAQELCYKVSREAVSNVLRHSEAKNVTIRLARAGRVAILQVDDDGSGEPPSEKSTRSGVGLLGMAERLELMGGSLKLERIGQNTRLTAEIPQL
jgi:signal transduction histidine kinase